MKTLLVTAAFLLTLCSGLVKAQSIEVQDAVNFETREMAVKLGLNEFGFIQLKKLNNEKAVNTQKIMKDYAYNPSLQATKLDELKHTYDSQLRAFLRSSQLEAYVALKAKSNNLIAQQPNK